MSLIAIYEEWEGLRREGKFSKDEINKVKSIKEEIKRAKLDNHKEAYRLVVYLIKEMKMQIHNSPEMIVEKLVFPSTSDDEKTEIENILNRIYTEED